MNIYSLLNDSTILSNLKVQDKEDLLNQMVDALSKEVDENQLKDIRESVFEREEVMSTGVGKQLAIPHGKVKSIEKNYASFAILEEPIDYNSIDGEPVKMVFLLAGPESKNSTHIKLLSRISRLMNSSAFRDALLECNSTKEILETFNREEERYFGN
ncbi:MAG: PTS sugar transporter subunit IIA [Balneolaceae bacterium]|nr:PTS sugar transporter subunit IIA [Balneolaceae bacterium]MCH8549227.1 PTS sugar transporter subunit IIA [Balneolaceae bacterium]